MDGAGFLTFLTGLISLIALIVFFVLASRIGTLVAISKKQIQQNDAILKVLAGDTLYDQDKAKLFDSKRYI